MAMSRSASDYAQQLKALLPHGPAWESDCQPALHVLLEALAVEFARVDMRAGDLLSEAFLDTFHEVLDDWERVLGLPDECVMDSGGAVAERKAQVLAKLVEKGGQTPAFFVALAKRFGYENAHVEEYRAPRFGAARFGRNHFGTWRSQFMWVLHLGRRLDGGLRFGAAVWGERLGGNPTDVIVCVIRRAAPAHTLVFVENS